MTRLQKLQQDGMPASLPPPGPGAYLVDYLLEVGPVTSTAMGSAPISWAEQQAWQQSTGRKLQAWEARTLRRLSTDWLNAAHDATSPQAPAPYSDEPTVDERQVIALKVRQALGGRAKPNHKVH